MKYFIFLLVTITSGCGWFKKDNKATPSAHISELSDRDATYCALSKPIVESHGGTTDEHCDAALFTSLHALQCGYANPGIFEDGTTGKLCRRPGCTCYPKQPGLSSSDSGFSKDMATGMQVFYSARPDKDFAKRVSGYLADNKLTACDAVDAVTLASKCVMSSKIVYRWAQVEKLGAERDRDEPSDEPQALTGNTEFRAHLDILGILTEYQLYSGISNSSIDTIKEQADREPNNLLYQAMLAKFVKGNQREIAEKLLLKFPADRLPTSDDWCTDYLYQRDEIRDGGLNKDWLPCDNKEIHSGTDYLLVSYILNLGT